MDILHTEPCGVVDAFYCVLMHSTARLMFNNVAFGAHPYIAYVAAFKRVPMSSKYIHTPCMLNVIPSLSTER